MYEDKPTDMHCVCFGLSYNKSKKLLVLIGEVLQKDQGRSTACMTGCMKVDEARGRM